MSFGEIWEIASSVVTIAAIIAAATPTPKDDEFIGKVYKWLIEIPAFNFGKAKEKGHG